MLSSWGELLEKSPIGIRGSVCYLCRCSVTAISPEIHEELWGWKDFKSAAGKKCSPAFALPFNLNSVNDLGKFSELCNIRWCFREDSLLDATFSSDLEAIILRFQHYLSIKMNQHCSYSILFTAFYLHNLHYISDILITLVLFSMVSVLGSFIVKHLILFINVIPGTIRL